MLMTKLIRNALAVLFSLLLGASLLASPAQADDMVIVPMKQKSTDAGVHTVLVEAPDNVYGLRPVIWDLEARTSGIDYIAAKGTKCSDNPDVSCLKVSIYKFPDGDAYYEVCGGAYACASAGGTDYRITGDPRWLDADTMCHEFGHTIGIMHHRHEGCTNEDPPHRDTLTWREINTVARNTPHITSLQP